MLTDMKRLKEMTKLRMKGREIHLNNYNLSSYYTQSCCYTYLFKAIVPIALKVLYELSVRKD